MQSDLKDWTPTITRGMKKQIERARRTREIERQVFLIYSEFLRLRREEGVRGTDEYVLREVCKSRGVDFALYYQAAQKIKSEGVGQTLNEYGVTWPPPDDLTF